MSEKEKNFVSSVIYVHNGEAYLGNFLKMIIDTMEANFQHSEIICVNDSSEDGSLEEIRRVSAGAVTTSVSVINMSYFHGLEVAMNAGVDMAIGDFVFEFDRAKADFDPGMIMEIYRRSLKGYDIVSAAPEKKERFSSKLFYKVFDHFTDLKYEMATESFRILSRRVINRISSMNRTIPYRKVVYSNCGLKTDLMRYPVTCQEREHLDPKEKRYRRQLATDSLLLFTKVGYHFSITMTIAMMLMSVFMIAYSLITYLLADPIEGWTTTVLFFSVAFFGLFGILTVVVKYLQLLVELIFKRKRYNFESIEKITK